MEKDKNFSIPEYMTAIAKSRQSFSWNADLVIMTRGTDEQLEEIVADGVELWCPVIARVAPPLTMPARGHLAERSRKAIGFSRAGLGLSPPEETVTVFSNVTVCPDTAENVVSNDSLECW